MIVEHQRLKVPEIAGWVLPEHLDEKARRLRPAQSQPIERFTSRDASEEMFYTSSWKGGKIAKVDVQGPQGEVNKKLGGNVIADFQIDRGKGL